MLEVIVLLLSAMIVGGVIFYIMEKEREIDSLEAKVDQLEDKVEETDYKPWWGRGWYPFYSTYPVRYGGAPHHRPIGAPRPPRYFGGFKH